jgi:hypothetical protein
MIRQESVVKLCLVIKKDLLEKFYALNRKIVSKSERIVFEL